MLGIVWLVVADVWLLRHASLTGAVDSILVDPPMLLSVIGILLGATVVHELGHAAACRYGDATPGGMGMGLYLVWPAFYTDVTEPICLLAVDPNRVTAPVIAENLEGGVELFPHIYGPTIDLQIGGVTARLAAR